MKNIDKVKVLENIRKIFKENNINITACGCCGGYHIEIDDDDVCTGCNFMEDVTSSIEYYNDNQNKIYINYYQERFPNITMIKDGNKIVNLGGRSHPFTKYMKHMNNEQFIEYFKDFI